MERLRQDEEAERALTIGEVALLVGVATGTIFRWEAEGEFPRSRRLGRGATRWLYSEVMAWLRSRPLRELTRRTSSKATAAGT